ncbi:MAG TPA: sulfatase-like hydrolase/transferase [Tepidisphaeraceae bacterium]|nr:sulfatase-like hydrolase/transferase [Tepidisphaeraceae bacterium]
MFTLIPSSARLWMAVFFLLSLTTLSSAQPTSQPSHPNIILILADDLGYADIGVQAVEPDVKTPHIDSIAHDGVRFTTAYVSCPVCSPSRAGILTGRYQERFGHESNPVAAFDQKWGLPLNQTLLSNEFHRINYATGALGKWHEGDTQPYWPLQRGFDEFFGFAGGMHAYFNANRTAAQDGFNVIRRGNDPVTEKEYLTDAITREALSFIDRHQSQPFFLYVAYNAPHVPQQAPPRYLKRFSDITDPKRKIMLAMLAAEDDGVGDILSKLHDTHLENNTLVIFLSDNGGPTAENASRNAPFRGFKGQVWEGGLRVPFMAKWPGHIPAGKTIDQPVISLDLFPTFLAAAGATPDPKLQLDGVNILPLLEGKPQPNIHPTLYWRFEPQWAIRDGHYKLETARDHVTRLYDLSKDPTETTDLFTAKPDIAQSLKTKYDKWASQLMAPLWPGRQEGDQTIGQIDAEEATADAD